jgi:hypothetical protein
MGAGYPESPILCSVPETENISSDGRCDDCEECDPELFFCNACELSFCSACWDAQLAHRKRKPGAMGAPHEKTNVRVAEKIHQALTPCTDDASQSRLLTEEEDMTWFGMRQWLRTQSEFTPVNSLTD